MIKLTLKDGSIKEVEQGSTIYEVAKEISEGLARVATCGIVNGEVKDLRYELNEDCNLSIETFDSSLDGKKAYWHTTSHIMAQAVQRLFPNVKFAIGPSIENGFYYDFDVEKPFTDEDKADFVKSSMTQNTYDGKLYAVGATESSVAFYYNKDYLKECGVDTDDLDSRTLENPLTTDEVAEIAEKCTTDDYVGTHIIMDHGEGLPYALEPLYLSAGKDYISEDGKEADGYVNSEEAVNTTAWLADLIAKGYANVEPITDEFLNGACATMIGGSWEIATLEQNADFDWGVTYYPVNAETKKAVSPCGDWAAAISKDCENADAAGEFLAWLMNTDNVASYAAAIAKPATRSSAYETEAMAEYKEGARALIVDQLENTAVPRPRTPSYATFSAAYAEAMTNIFSDAASNEEADTDYIQSEFDTVVDTFTEDYETYYAE